MECLILGFFVIIDDGGWNLVEWECLICCVKFDCFFWYVEDDVICFVLGDGLGFGIVYFFYVVCVVVIYVGYDDVQCVGVGEFGD